MIRQLRPLSLVLLIASVPGCYTSHDYGPSPQAALQAQPNSKLIVRRKGGTNIEVDKAAVVSDSLVGLGLAPGPNLPRPRVAIPLSDIVRVRTHQFDGAQTYGIVGVALLVPAFMIFASFQDDPS